MMKKSFIFLLLICSQFAFSQLNVNILGKWTLKVTVKTEFTDSESAVKQVKTNKEKYAYLDASVWNFKKEGELEIIFKDGKKELANYSANEDRFLIIFKKEEIEEFNTTNILIDKKNVRLSLGRGMTNLIFDFNK